MNRPERRKAYKSTEPLHTVNTIRRILEECDMFLYEYHLGYQLPGVFHSRLWLGDEEFHQLNIGTNGKGMNPRYAAASAYGEFMERLQNSALFPVRQTGFALEKASEGEDMQQLRARLVEADAVLNFKFAPDETVRDIDDVLELCRDVLTDAFGGSGIMPEEEIRGAFEGFPVQCVPFYSVNEDSTRLLPAKILWNSCGSNGMCAGNTPHEAIIQGLGEIFERYAIRKIYQAQLQLPTIPAELFAGTEIYKKLCGMAEKGYRFTIKDCSVGEELPVIGLLLENTGSGTYTFHLGADPSPVTALERCLTEIYQGNSEAVAERFKNRQDDGTVVFPEETDKKKRRAYINELCKTIESGFGKWPECIFAESTAFTGFAHPVSLDDRDDLQYLTDICLRNGRKLFIRDVSWLGFPAYQVYIPGMSEADFIPGMCFSDLGPWMELVRNQRTLINLPNAEKEELVRLAVALHEVQENSLALPFNPEKWYVSNVNFRLQQYDSDLLSIMIYAVAGKYDWAASHMQEYLNSKVSQNGPRLYYKALYEYYRLLDSREEKPEDKISSCFGSTLAERCQASTELGKAFDRAVFPVCFHCDSCGVRENCRFVIVMAKLKKLHEIYQKNLPNQATLSEIFRDRKKSVVQ